MTGSTLDFDYMSSMQPIVKEARDEKENTVTNNSKVNLKYEVSSIICSR